jgi:hypothetical protein
MLCLRNDSATNDTVDAVASIPSVIVSRRAQENRSIPSVDTSLDHINPNILNTSLDLLPHERCRRFMNPIDPLSILSSESRRGGHSVAAMCRYNFLVSLKAPACLSLAPIYVCGMASRSFSPRVFTHAPPELSEPAITRMRFISVVDTQHGIFDVLDGDSESHKCNVNNSDSRPGLTSSNAWCQSMLLYIGPQFIPKFVGPTVWWYHRLAQERLYCT